MNLLNLTRERQAEEIAKLRADAQMLLDLTDGCYDQSTMVHRLAFIYKYDAASPDIFSVNTCLDALRKRLHKSIEMLIYWQIAAGMADFMQRYKKEEAAKASISTTGRKRAKS